jgi:hypothetical protein
MFLDAAKIEKALSRLGDMALEAGRVIDLAVYGGSALTIAYVFAIQQMMLTPYSNKTNNLYERGLRSLHLK